MSTAAIHPADDAVLARPRRLLLFDPLLLLAGLGLAACSLVILHGATATAVRGSPLYYVERQAIYIALGLAIAVLIARVDYSRLREYKFGLYGLLIVSNALVFALGSTSLGAQRRFNLPLFQVQPSEFGKLLLVVSLAAFAVDRSRRLHEWSTTARITLLALGPALLVIAQPDLGTGMVLVVVGFAMLFLAGTAWKQLAALVAMFAVAIAIVLAGAPGLGVHVVKPYQVQRLTGFLNPSSNPRSGGYQIHQSLITIGSGQKTGLGVANAKQTTLGYIPENSTDFVFSVVGETYGFAGAALVLLLYALLIWRALRILTMSKNLYGTLIAGGILAMLMFQVFVNVGMTVGIMPVTGVPLPLLSYGGSSVLVTFIALGLLQAIHIQARMASAGKNRTLIS